MAKNSATLCVEGRAGGLKSTVLRDGRPWTLGGPKMCKCLILNCDNNKEVPHAKILKCCFLNFLSVRYN